MYLHIIICSVVDKQTDLSARNDSRHDSVRYCLSKKQFTENQHDRYIDDIKDYIFRNPENLISLYHLRVPLKPSPDGLNPPDIHSHSRKSQHIKFIRRSNRSQQDCRQIKGAADLSALGIKTLFCSNVCAAWRRERYLELGGFEKKTIFNEDMILAGRLIREGGLIAYCADAKVIHSHNYSALQQFHRNFDLAVSQTMHPEVFGGIRSESEGIRLVKMSIKHCVQIRKPWLCFQVLTQSAGKYLGYKMGQKYQSLPRKMILWCTMNPTFWQEEMR